MTANGSTSDVLVSTTHGTLRGTTDGSVARFLGVPFAAAPVGDLRFRPPAPFPAWDGARDAVETGPVCPQNPSLMDALFGGEAEQWDEDCLFLNVWTPSALPDPATPLPVMVWIHGGGFEMGSGSSPLYNGTHFAASGVVLVTLNYRLGALGFLELGGVDPAYTGSGNVGLLDQIAALEWVRDNIANFGGDPSNVTVFGQSAGAMSVSLLLSMPRARGLFQKAIAQSGAAEAARTIDDANADAQEFFELGGWSTVDDVRSAPVGALLAAHQAMAGARFADPEAFMHRAGNPLAFLSFRPVADGRDVPLHPLAEIAAGAAQGVSLLCGTTSEEWKLFAMMTPPAADEPGLRQRLAAVTPDPDATIAAYRLEHPEASLGDLEGAVLTDLVFRMPANRLIDAQRTHAPTFQYLWAWRSNALGGMIGAAHAIEIPFVFDLVEDHRLHVFVGPDAPGTLAACTNAAWIAFAATGRPAADGLPSWPAIGDEERPVMILDETAELAADPGGSTRAFWAALSTTA